MLPINRTPRRGRAALLTTLLLVLSGTAAVAAGEAGGGVAGASPAPSQWPACTPRNQVVDGSWAPAYPPVTVAVNADLATNWPLGTDLATGAPAGPPDPGAFATNSPSFPERPALVPGAGGTGTYADASTPAVMDPVVGPSGQELQTFTLDSHAYSPYDNSHGDGLGYRSSLLGGGSLQNDDGTTASALGAPTTPVATVSPTGAVGTPAPPAPVQMGGTTTYPDPVRVNVLLPPGYDPASGTRYPVLYLLPGTGDDEGFSSWLWDEGAAPAQRAMPVPTIFVMPDAPLSGADSDWYGLTASDAIPGSDVPAWTSFFLSELVPWVDRTYPTVAGPAGRFVAGLSAGGGAAMAVAAEHPGTFGAVGSFSGSVDNLSTGLFAGLTNMPWMSALIDGDGVGWDTGEEGPDPTCAAGAPLPQLEIWAMADPTVVPANLGGTRLWMAAGQGSASLGSLYDAGLAAIENVVGTMTYHLARSLQVNGVDGNPPVGPVSLAGLTAYDYGFADAAAAPGAGNVCASTVQVCVDVYGGGEHQPSYWADDLRSFDAWLGGQMGDVGGAYQLLLPPVPSAAGVGYQAVDTSNAAPPSFWGWTFRAVPLSAQPGADFPVVDVTPPGGAGTAWSVPPGTTSGVQVTWDGTGEAVVLAESPPAGTSPIGYAPGQWYRSSVDARQAGWAPGDQQTPEPGSARCAQASPTGRLVFPFSAGGLFDPDGVAGVAVQGPDPAGSGCPP